MGGAGFEHLLLRSGQLAHHLAGRAHNQRAIRNFLAFTYQAVGADDAVLTDSGAIEDHRIDADQTVIAHRTTVQHGVMANGHPSADIQWKAHVGVHHGTVLHIAVLADMNQLVVTAQHGVKPHAGTRLQFDLADQRGIRCNPAVGMGLDVGRTQAVFHGYFLNKLR